MKKKYWITAIESLLITFAILVPMKVVDMSGVAEDGILVKLVFFLQNLFWEKQEAFLLLFLCLTFVLIKTKKAFPNRRYDICFGIASAIFGALMVTSHSFFQSNALDLIFENKWYLLRGVAKAVGYALMLFESSRLIITSNIGKKIKEGQIKCRFDLFETKRRILWIVLIFAVCWIPYFILCAPGNMTLDSRDELAQVYQIKEETWTYGTMLHENPDDNAITNHQPVFYTVLMGGTARLGEVLGNINIGIALFSLFQMAAAIAVLTYLLIFLKNRNISSLYLYGILTFFALFPIFPYYAVTMTKDMLFSTVMLWMILELYQLVAAFRENRKTLLHSVLYVVSGIVFCLLRNNGSYILILLIPFLFFVMPSGKRIRTVGLTLIPVAFYFLVFLQVILPLAKIEGGSKREMMCVPFQQVARYVSEWGDKGLSQKDIQALDKVLQFNGDVKVLAERYNPTYADPVKAYYRKEATGKEVSDFFKVWFKMVMKHPGTAIAATLNNNFQLTYSSGYGTIIYVNQVTKNHTWPWYGVSENQYGAKAREQLLNAVNYIASMPIAGLLFSLGFYDWIICFVLMYLIASRKYHCLPICLLMIMCIATSVLGPVIYMRYGLAWVMSVPVLGALMMDEGMKRRTHG